MIQLTFVIGFSFLLLQLNLWNSLSKEGLTVQSDIASSLIYFITGFHGAHVTLGTIMLLVSFLRGLRGHFKDNDHFGFEAAAWYWHFVDVVWVGLFLIVYVFD